jgi:hypothetical protein
MSILKYLLEGIAVALATGILSRGKTSAGEVFLMAISSMAVFLVLDLYAPLTAAGARQGAGFGLGFKMVGMSGGAEQMAGAGEPDMCGGGLLEALQTAGAVSDIVIPSGPARIPAKITRCGALLAGYNEDAEAYNVAKIDNIAAY